MSKIDDSFIEDLFNSGISHDCQITQKSIKHTHTAKECLLYVNNKYIQSNRE